MQSHNKKNEPSKFLKCYIYTLSHYSNLLQNSFSNILRHPWADIQIIFDLSFDPKEKKFGEVSTVKNLPGHIWFNPNLKDEKYIGACS